MSWHDSIKTRLNSPSGISFTEFSYNLLQAYDFMHLFKMFNCSIQLGGSDQLGNIMAGIEMMQRENLLSSNVNGGEKHAYGLTLPLLTTSSGAKFGKSAGNAIWMDSQRTHPFDLYQVRLNHSTHVTEKCLTVMDCSSFCKALIRMPYGISKSSPSFLYQSCRRCSQSMR